MDTTSTAVGFAPTAEHLEDPYPFYAWARVHQPVFFSPQFQMWCVTRYADVSAVLGDSQAFSSRDSIPDFAELGPEVQQVLNSYRPARSLLNMDPPDHTALRRLVRQVFAPRRVATMEPAVREVTEAVIDGFVTDGHADLVRQFAYPLPLTVIFRLLGIPASDMEMCRQWTADLKELIFSGSRLPVSRQVELARGVLAYQHYLEDLVSVRDADLGEDLASYLIQATDEQGHRQLSLFQVTDQVEAFIIGGHETIGNGLGNILYQLLAEPARWHAICADPSLIGPVVTEGLRADSPVSAIIRTTTRPVELGGVRLPAGARLLLLLGSANTDGDCYPDPRRFRTDRAGQPAHLAFGRGIHHCIGAPLAVLEARVAVELLSRRLPGLRLAADAQLTHVPVPLFRGYTRLPVSWGQRP